MAAKETPKAPDRASNTVGLLDGYQDLNTGLVHKTDGTVVIPAIETPELALSEERIGVYRRVVYADGSVATTQVAAR